MRRGIKRLRTIFLSPRREEFTRRSHSEGLSIPRKWVDSTSWILVELSHEHDEVAFLAARSHPPASRAPPSICGNQQARPSGVYFQRQETGGSGSQIRFREA